ncbi:excisionase family DNA binding protein [Cryobacterium sp. MP_M5]|uniref:helix-turn-helix domain-containing protein n=1 Tax=Cryobacterium sp. MP_M5 TaxID=3071715 RepID=UPI002DF85B47|nr:excisionase family DNA binding protein [Cryobacterium sp. MP_M5]
MLSDRLLWGLVEKVHDPVRVSWGDLEHLRVMNAELLSGLGLEPVLTTSELAEYLGVHVQAIYDLRTDGRGPPPPGIRVGREIRYRVSDVVHWLDGLHEPVVSLGAQRGDR